MCSRAELGYYWSDIRHEVNRHVLSADSVEREAYLASLASESRKVMRVGPVFREEKVELLESEDTITNLDPVAG